jgi:hypothetical protein
MSDRKDLLGKPEEENTANSSTQSASGLGGGTPEGGPVRPDERARREERPDRTRDTAGEDGIENPALPDDDVTLPSET